ncbi:hypothetical protein K491DRAFT_710822 [Lophiostoma macrostomum CBS 122681]|uniref:Rhodopsin domain-containing protein n=1 Tax=Lophiostoma macrostomum CBS 122681 TaxID=1314788 RepID=A0A6A6TNH8_9PLEO|nr:hypothetical protein K491DRAFT_710822 [Lophiostoma macrostomum CBS 122681]
MSAPVATATSVFRFDDATTDTPAFLAEDIGPSLLATASIFIFLSTLFVILRYYARYLTSTKFGAEDVIIPFAWLAEIGVCVTSIVMVEKAGTGRHADFVQMSDPGKIMEHYRGIMVLELLHLMAVGFPKACVVMLYLRVFTNKWARIGTWLLIGAIVATWFSYTIAAIFQCVPFAYNWDKSIPNGHCFNVLVFANSSSVPNIATDIAVLFLPIRTILDLKISRGRRFGLFLIFMVGSVGIIASIVRTIVFARTDPLVDITFTNVELIKWTIIEPGMYLMAACGLSYKPLFRMAARALHLDTLLTHSQSRKQKTTRTGTTQTGLQLDTLKSAHHVGFKKLEAGRNGEDDEEDVEFGKDGLDIMVTRTVEMDVEHRREDEWGLETGLAHEQPDSRFSVYSHT